jgi:hypothetical protein
MQQHWVISPLSRNMTLETCNSHSTSVAEHPTYNFKKTALSIFACPLLESSQKCTIMTQTTCKSSLQQLAQRKGTLQKFVTLHCSKPAHCALDIVLESPIQNYSLLWICRSVDITESPSGKPELVSNLLKIL